jgi:hypothetical protein
MYKSQYKKAKETLDILEIQKTQINFNLKSNSISADLHKNLRTVDMEIKITLNEMEHAESCIQRCESISNVIH